MMRRLMKRMAFFAALLIAVCAYGGNFTGSGDVSIKSYDKVVIPEMNLGQLATLIRARYLVDAISVTQVRGLPFKADELAEMFQGVINHD